MQVYHFFPQGKGDINVTVESRQRVAPSVYDGHPSYAFPQGRDYAMDRGYPGGPGHTVQNSQFFKC